LVETKLKPVSHIPNPQQLKAEEEVLKFSSHFKGGGKQLVSKSHSQQKPKGADKKSVSKSSTKQSANRKSVNSVEQRQKPQKQKLLAAKKTHQPATKEKVTVQQIRYRRSKLAPAVDGFIY